jgi:hypothetical protein
VKIVSGFWFLVDWPGPLDMRKDPEDACQSRDRQEALRVRRAPPNGPGTDPRRAPFCAKFLRSAKGAARTAKRTRNWLAPHAVLREALAHPCAKFLRSAKGAARTAKRTRNWPRRAPCYASSLEALLNTFRGLATYTRSVPVAAQLSCRTLGRMRALDILNQKRETRN